VIKHDKAKDKKGLIDYNCHIFQDALSEVFAKNWQKDSEAGDDTESHTSISVAQSRLESNLQS
jgi:Ras-related GTP-binding protein C/D